MEKILIKETCERKINSNKKNIGREFDRKKTRG
jgi:hypothetical protein